MARTLTLPLKIAADGTLGSITQGHPAEIAQSVGLLLATRPGDRRVNPEYGYPDPVHLDPYAAAVQSEIAQGVVAEWEPRASITDADTALSDGTVTETTRVHLEEA